MLFAAIFPPAQRACNFDTSADRTVGSAIVCDRLRLYGNNSLYDRLRSAIYVLRSSAIIWKPALTPRRLGNIKFQAFPVCFVVVVVFFFLKDGGRKGVITLSFPGMSCRERGYNCCKSLAHLFVPSYAERSLVPGVENCSQGDLFHHQIL